MSSKRPVILMGILLALLGAFFVWPALQDRYLANAAWPGAAAAQPTKDQPPLPGENGVSNLIVRQQPDGRWIASFDYFYTGAPHDAMVRVFQMVHGGGGGGATPIRWQVGGMSAQRGKQHFSTEVFNPNVHQMYTTSQVLALMDVAPAPPLTQVAVSQHIQWPDPLVVEVEQAIAAGKTDAIVQKAALQIDTNHPDEVQKARALLQTLVEKSPRTDAAYVELARTAMKLNWGPAGLRDAENLLLTALQLQPDSVNAKILLGYVRTHQGRYKEAEPLFVEAAAANPPNLWLWANWGQLLAMQNRIEPAISKYREAIARPPTNDTYDRARHDAYDNLLKLLRQRKDTAGLEALYKQRAQEYAGKGCFAIDYARFLVLQHGDAEGAAAVLRDTPSPQCDLQGVREVQGLGHYVNWSKGTDPERTASLHQARALLPVGPSLFYTLASTDRGAALARQLVASGEKVDVQDNQQFDALAYALRNGETGIARRLLGLGARPTAEVGPERMPAALIPVFTRDFDSIRLMQRAGVDYTKLQFQGSTALDHARERDDGKLLQALDPRSRSL